MRWLSLRHCAAARGERCHRLPAAVLLRLDLALALDPGLDLLGERVDRGRAGAVQAPETSSAWRIWIFFAC